VKGKPGLFLHHVSRAPVASWAGGSGGASSAPQGLPLTTRGASFIVVLGLIALSACSSLPPHPETSVPQRKPGGYYLDDGPGANAPTNLDQIPNPEPRLEPIKASTSRPYTVFGRTYTPMARLGPYRERGTASWYGKRYHGQATASGETYDMYAMTAAHPTLPIPSFARVTNLRTGKSVVVRINDRGPFHGDRVIDLSYTAAYKLGMTGSGSDLVEVQSIVPDEAPTTGIAAQFQGPAEATSRERPAELTVGQEPAGVYVQLGAFTLRPNAESFLTRMRVEMSWLGSAIGMYARDGLYRVHAGPYADRIQADEVARRIEQSMDLQPVLITR
jgi:rare lipoprotein A